MPRSHIGSISAFVIAGAALCVPASPVAAASCSTLDAVVATFVAQGASVYIIPHDRLAVVAQDAEAVTGAHYAGVTRGFLVGTKDSVIIGLEVGGCLLDPIRLQVPSADPPKVAAAA